MFIAKNLNLLIPISRIHILLKITKVIEHSNFLLIIQKCIFKPIVVSYLNL